MTSVVRVLSVVVVAIAALGCGGRGTDSPQRSKVVSKDSAEHQRAKAEQDEFERQAKEAERKALGSHQIE